MHDFQSAIIEYCEKLYNLAYFASDRLNRESVLSRVFLGRLNLEATWMEETLDGAGARKNSWWFPFREAVSGIKLFSTVIYELLHIRKGISHYRLNDYKGDFSQRSDEVIDELYLTLACICKTLVKGAKSCGLHSNGKPFSTDVFKDIEPGLRLENDRKLRHIKSPGKTLIYLATEYINLKDSMSLFKEVTCNNLPSKISEDKLRLILTRFHNLQSLYDTYLSESDIEGVDKRLILLRGHISFVFHMLKSSTELTHYYERHGSAKLVPLKEKDFLNIILGFYIKYLVFYFKEGVSLCYDIIGSYGEVSKRKIPIPAYRGFHVRPSTLISKIVAYYGASVKMVLNGREYDPSDPMELFRANEEINAIKRGDLIQAIAKRKLYDLDLKDIVSTLKNEGVVIQYQEEFDDPGIDNNETNIEYVKRAIAFLLATGVIGIKKELSVVYSGDTRVLNDLEILAEASYGEDDYGNNTSLPKELDYLRR